MKKKLIAITMMISAFVITSAKAQSPDAVQAEWKEKSAFHKVLAQTFHPSEEGNYEPIRTRIDELYKNAVAWINSSPPKEFDTPQLKTTLKELETQIMGLKEMIEKKATNEELKPKMEAMHDTFHKIVGMCTKEEKHDAGHEGHDHGTNPAEPQKEHKE